MNAVSLLITPALAKAALKMKKSAGSSKRIEGELPSAPPVAKDVPEWWDETTTVLDRIRTNGFTDYLKDRLENLEDALGIEGKAVGTETKQELNNKTADGGYF